MYLADYGADVVKVELPEGDPARTFPPFVPGTGIGKSFLALNRGKRSVALDYRTPQGRDAVDRLVMAADAVIVDRPPPSTRPTWALHYTRLRALNPRLVCTSITAFGRRGPLVELPPYEPLVQAATGAMAGSRTRDNVPVHTGFRLGESATAMMAAYGTMMALLVREKTGAGQRVDISMLHTAVAMQSVQLSWADDDPTPPSDPPQATVASYQCQDGRYINIITIQERQWQAMCRVLDIEHLLSDPEFASNTARGRRRAELFPLLEGIFGTRPSGEWLTLLQEAGVPCGPTLSRSELFDDPQIVANTLAAEVRYPGVGSLQVLGSPVVMSATPVRVGTATPQLGEHTRQVLEEAGFSQQELAELARAGIIR